MTTIKKYAKAVKRIIMPKMEIVEPSQQIDLEGLDLSKNLLVSLVNNLPALRVRYERI